MTDEVPDYQRLLAPVQIERLKALAVEFGVRGMSADDIPDDYEHSWERTINQDAVYAFADGVEDFSLWYVPGFSPFGGPVVPPLLLAQLCNRTLEKLGAMAGWVHAENRSHLIRPVFVGTTIRFEGRVASKFTKRGRKYVTLALKLFDTDGDELVFEEERTFAETFIAAREDGYEG
jgi:acyl dehydratase